MLLLLVAVLAGSACGMVHELKLVEDSRSSFLVESYGFSKGGFQGIETTEFETAKGATPSLSKFCFIIKITVSDESNFLDEELELKCSDGDIIIKPTSWKSLSHKMSIDEEPKGYYNLFFVNEDRVPITLDMVVTQRSTGSNYLSVGLLPLPTLYLVASGVWVCLIAAWVHTLYTATKPHRLHLLMTGMVVLKALQVIFESINYHYLNITGVPGGWTVASYVVSFCEGISLFCVVALIGTGYQFVKPFLSENDQKIFLIVLPLQILDNVALLIIEETIPGNVGWEAWKNVFRVTDIVCCGAVLVPIIWSIKHLRDAAATSGKAARNLQQLQLFRSFYLIVVVYIYTTRIIMYLFDATLPFHLTWMAAFVSEVATACFFVVVGYKFRPMENNPYLKEVNSDDEIDIEIDAFGEPTVDIDALEKKKKDDHARQVRAAALEAEQKLKEMMENKTQDDL